MPLPFFSLIPKQKVEGRFAEILNILFYLSLALILLSLASFFFLYQSLKKSDKTLKDLEGALISQVGQEQLEMEKNILEFRQKLKDFELLSNQHRFTSNALQVLENLAHSKVWFSDFQLNIQDSQLILKGEADNINILGEQLLVFKKSAEIKETALSDVKTNPNGKIEFQISLTVDPKVFSVERGF